MPVVVVCNGGVRVPDHPLVTRVVVSDAFDAADDWIAERAGPGAVVVTGDILLADRALKEAPTPALRALRTAAATLGTLAAIGLAIAIVALGLGTIIS